MGKKNRTILMVAVAVIVFAAMFVSAGFPSLVNPIPKVTLSDVTQSSAGEEGKNLLTVSVNPQTVQNVVSTLSRPDSYSRELTVELYWSTGDEEERSSSDRVQIWADGEYVKTTVNTGSGVQHQLVGDGVLRIWYDGDSSWKELPSRGVSGDLAQRIPTYEDVLELDPSQITAAGYEDRNGKACVYVEVAEPLLEIRERYWIETATGLLCAAETEENGRIVYRMSEESLRIPLEDGYAFTLPDGSVLHERDA